MHRISSESFSCSAIVSRFWVFWIRNTIRNVMMVVEVLITSCQVSLKPNIGPLRAQTSTSAIATKNETGLPIQCAMAQATLEKVSFQLLAGAAAHALAPFALF